MSVVGIAALLLLGAQAALPQPVTPSPTAEAEELGLRLAHAGTLAALMRLRAPDEIERIVAGHPELDAADQHRLREIGRQRIEEETERLLSAEGHAFAERLSVADLRLLVAAAESDAGKRRDAILPAVIKATIEATAQIDFGAETVKAFCKAAGKLCE